MFANIFLISIDLKSILLNLKNNKSGLFTFKVSQLLKQISLNKIQFFIVDFGTLS